MSVQLHEFLKPLKTAGICLLLLGSVACRKKVDGVPFIRAVSPLTGPRGTQVTIKGKYFGSSSTQVQFNHLVAEIISVSDTMIKVKVPKGAGTGDITVITGGSTIQGPEFEYAYTATVSTVAGNGTAGFTDGPGTSATLDEPTQLAIDKDDNLFIVDQTYSTIRKLNAQGLLSTYAGNGTNTNPVDGTGTNARFHTIRDICAVPNSNTLYVAGYSGPNHISKVVPENNLGKVTTFYTATSGYADNSDLAQGRFQNIFGLTADASSNLYAWDRGNYCARKISLIDSSVTTVAGKPGTSGFNDGQGQDAMFQNVYDIVFAPDGNLVVTDRLNNRLRKITTSGMVSTFAGNGVRADIDGPLPSPFNQPLFSAFDKRGNAFVITGSENNILRLITANGEVYTLIKNSVGFKDGPAEVAQFSEIGGIAIDSKNRIYVSDINNHRIRRIEVE